ncbi:MAG: NnrU family protein [Bauldia sp.]|uniref:NnrU family protein n=1 Tax=Bauldia sp. TaxID=2575872 RepID=UPI001D5AD1C1|nr:NnrU family protein [Bauldia sp.]MCB1497434.1 NnrU family protein [Bauldia sp.]
MLILVVGLILFLGAHSFRMLAPAGRDAALGKLGEGPYKGAYAVVSLIGFVLIIWGFGRTASDSAFLYAPPFWLRHVTELLVLVALILAVASALPPSHISRAVRHPLLIGTMLWAVAHLFVNGEVGTTLLFGAFLIWAVLDLVSQGRRPATAKAPPSWRFDIIAVVAGAVIYGLLVWRAHLWLFGVSPIA